MPAIIFAVTFWTNSGAWTGTGRRRSKVLVTRAGTLTWDKRAMVLSSSTAILPEDVEVLMKGEKEGEPAVVDMTLEGMLKDRIHCFIKKTKNLGKSDVYDSVLALVERPLIVSALAETNYNQVKAAELLGINRNTLRKKITELSIPVKKPLTNGQP